MIDPFFWFAAFLASTVFLVTHSRDAAKADEEIRTLNRRLDRLQEELDEYEDHYTSTACWHELHNQCRKTCKFCEKPCLCDCHEDDDDPRNGFPIKPPINWRFWKKPEKAPHVFRLEKPTYETVERMR